MKYIIRLSGSNGQEIILAGAILVEAAGIYGGKNATQTQSYKPGTRGGASKSDVMISDEIINSYQVTSVDLLLALNQEACDKNYIDLKEKGILIVDSGTVTNIPNGNFTVFKIPIVKTAREQIGNYILSNIVALGAIAEISKVVTLEALEQSICSMVEQFVEVNIKALHAGAEIAKKSI